MVTVQTVLDAGSYKTVTLVPVYSSDKESPNYSWSQYTPSGKIELSITNPAAYEQFAPGKKFLLTFTETE